jgi:hypothetical protein
MDLPGSINLDRIEFISEYCDRWCERCSFTSRCSSYAIDVAMAMCDGDFAAALELAIGAPPRQDAAEAAKRDAFLERLRDDQPAEAELEEIKREEDARDERVDESPITTIAEKAFTLATGWLESHQDVSALESNRQLADAVEIAEWDSCLVSAKLHRALHGRDRFKRGDMFDDDPVQSDWNGSAKVALISIRRSIGAWATIAALTDDLDTATVAAELRCLEIEVERAYPDAWKFIRPGFDQVP